ncbi:hypothetical protein MPSEU_000438600 [Mayamaea pseudoterrestris]|nr:hypothetical protein MPSEU_000438600 [Mayamaea pseudoterrestris]
MRNMKGMVSILLLALVASCSAERDSFTEQQSRHRRQKSSYLRRAIRQIDTAHRQLSYSDEYAAASVGYAHGSKYADPSSRHNGFVPPPPPPRPNDSYYSYYTSKGTKATKGSKSVKGTILSKSSKGTIPSFSDGEGYFTPPPSHSTTSAPQTSHPTTNAPSTSSPSTMPSLPAKKGVGRPQKLPDILPDYSLDRYSDDEATGDEDPTGGDVNVTNATSTSAALDEFTAASDPHAWQQDFQLSNVELQMLQNAEEYPASTATTAQVTIQSNTCELGSTGFYGEPIGTVYDITFIYQALLTSNATDTILQTEVAPALDIGIPEALLPSFFSECSNSRRRLQMAAATIEGVSRMQTDYVVMDPNLCVGGASEGNCYVFSGSINVFGDNFYTQNDVENTVMPVIQKVIQSGQLTSLSPYLEKVTYLESGLVTSNPVPTTAPKPTAAPVPTRPGASPTIAPVPVTPTVSAPTFFPPTPSAQVPSIPTAPSAPSTSGTAAPTPTTGSLAPTPGVPSQPTQSPMAVSAAPNASPSSKSKRGVDRVPWWGWLLIALFGFAVLAVICYLALAEDDGPRSKPSSSDVPDKDGDASYEPPGGDGYVPPGGVDSYADTMDTSAFRIQPPSGSLGVVQEVGENQDGFQYGDEGEDDEGETYEDDEDAEGDEEYEEGDEGEEDGDDDEEGEYEDGEEYEEGDEEYDDGDEEGEEYDDEYEEGEEEPVSGDEEDEGSYYEEETMETPDESDGQRQWR